VTAALIARLEVGLDQAVAGFLTHSVAVCCAANFCPLPVLLAAGLFVAAAFIPRLEVGLDQAVALPRDSYMQQYYRCVIVWVI
jgi:Niemann-Pick C1 protein